MWITSSQYFSITLHDHYMIGIDRHSVLTAGSFFYQKIIENPYLLWQNNSVLLHTHVGSLHIYSAHEK